MHHPTDRITHTTAFVTPVVEHWLEREIAQWVHPMKDRSDNPSGTSAIKFPFKVRKVVGGPIELCLAPASALSNQYNKTRGMHYPAKQKEHTVGSHRCRLSQIYRILFL